MAWIKWDTRGLRDAKIAELDDAAFRLWIAMLSEAWHQNPKGTFTSEKHLRACVSGIADPRKLKQLLQLELVCINESGAVIIANWEKHQIDPTAKTRKERWKNANGTQMERAENNLDKDKDKDKDFKVLSYTRIGSQKPRTVAEILQVKRGEA
jgi:hypothetical protein